MPYNGQTYLFVLLHLLVQNTLLLVFAALILRFKLLAKMRIIPRTVLVRRVVKVGEFQMMSASDQWFQWVS